MLQVIGTIFSGTGKVGDFGWMIRQPEYADALFIFNDNEEQFRAHRAEPQGSYGCSPGGGNAVVRPYQCQEPPRAIGIPTGSRGQGYATLSEQVRQTIDEAILAIQNLLATGRYRRLYYSAADAAGNLGTGIFDVDADVKRYVSEKVRSLTES